MLQAYLNFLQDITGLDQLKCILLTGFCMLIYFWILMDYIGSIAGSDELTSGKTE